MMRMKGQTFGKSDLLSNEASVILNGLSRLECVHVVDLNGLSVACTADKREQPIRTQTGAGCKVCTIGQTGALCVIAQAQVVVVVYVCVCVGGGGAGGSATVTKSGLKWLWCLAMNRRSKWRWVSSWKDSIFQVLKI